MQPQEKDKKHRAVRMKQCGSYPGKAGERSGRQSGLSYGSCLFCCKTMER